MKTNLKGGALHFCEFEFKTDLYLPELSMIIRPKVAANEHNTPAVSD